MQRGEPALRLERLLANMGCGTRKEVKLLIKSGKVAVNGKILRDPGAQVIPGQGQIVCNGQAVEYRKYIYLMMNKPAGVISATEDAKDRTVLDLLDPQYRHKGIFPVGRLDKDTEGLLLLTNDGPLGHRLLSPKKKVFKTYYARVQGQVTAADREAFRNGIVLDDGYRTLPGDLNILSEGPISEVEVMICEGKYHQVKRMFLALGKQVLYLKRVAMGDLVLDPRLRPGEYRELESEEIQRLTAVTE